MVRVRTLDEKWSKKSDSIYHKNTWNHKYVFDSIFYSFGCRRTEFYETISFAREKSISGKVEEYLSDFIHVNSHAGGLYQWRLYSVKSILWKTVKRIRLHIFEIIFSEKPISSFTQPNILIPFRRNSEFGKMILTKTTRQRDSLISFNLIQIKLKTLLILIVFWLFNAHGVSSRNIKNFIS